MSAFAANTIVAPGNSSNGWDDSKAKAVLPNGEQVYIEGHVMPGEDMRHEYKGLDKCPDGPDLLEQKFFMMRKYFGAFACACINMCVNGTMYFGVRENKGGATDSFIYGVDLHEDVHGDAQDTGLAQKVLNHMFESRCDFSLWGVWISVASADAGCMCVVRGFRNVRLAND